MDNMERFKLLIAVIGILTLLGMLVILLLLVFWRQQLKRQARQSQPKDKSITPPQQDLWYESGQRLSRRMATGEEASPSEQDDDLPDPPDDHDPPAGPDSPR